ncbi:MAG TPA: TrmJ/YjtD family RNA methyltransferase [Longimicrobiaceae bacterium]|nr:TrmJ/YjtD family RNA methyltransferase [Longimicrobiaceae bacterium]
MTETNDSVPDGAGAHGRAALDGIVVVLWQTQDRVNVAGTIRAMKNFGLRNLRLVAPAEWDPWRIEGIAHDTQDLIQATRIFDTLEEALADCAYVVGMTARARRAKRAVGRPREVAPELLERAADAVRGAAGPVAVLFGREDKGLSNEALDLCHRTVIIPTSPEYSSLNLAQAVLTMAYELWMEAEGRMQPFRDPRHVSPPAPVEQLELLFADVERALWAVDFFKSRQTETVMRTLREVARRAELDTREATFLRAMAIEVLKFVRRRLGDDAVEESAPGEEPPRRE